MSQIRILFHLMRADFLQRIRNFSFVIVAALAVYISYLYVPPVGANYLTMGMGPIRGVYNSAWVGLMFGIVTATILPMFVFYLIKNSVERDRTTRVGQIVAATPISKPAYLLGKWLSNLAVLASIMLVMTVMALVMQWLRGEETAVYLLPLITPIWLMGLPVMGIVAALAVLFESIPFLSGSLGNVVYFFLWNIVMVTALPGIGADIEPTNDMLGILRPFHDVQQYVQAINPTYDGTFSVGFVGYEGEIKTFLWAGIPWGIVDVGRRVLWLLAGVCITFVAAIPFDRFDTARRQTKVARANRLPRPLRRLFGQTEAGDAPKATAKMANAANICLTPLPSTANHFRFAPILLAELRLALKGLPWYWFVVALGVIIAELTTSVEIGLKIGLAATVWPMMIFSTMGTREVQNHTRKIIFSAAFPLQRQLPATWLTGVLIAVAMSAGILLRLMLAGEWIHLLGVIVGTLFVPSLALALGVWSSSTRLFEVLFLFWWYIALNGVPALDFMSAMTTTPTLAIPLAYLAGVVALLGTAVIGRRFNLQA